MELRWRAVYDDGTETTNIGAKSNYGDIDHSRLARFDLYDDTRETERHVRTAYGDAARRFEEYNIEERRAGLGANAGPEETKARMNIYAAEKRGLEDVAQRAMNAHNVAQARSRQADYLPVLSVILRGDGGEEGRRLIYRRRTRMDLGSGRSTHFYIAGYQYTDAAGKNHQIVSHIYGNGSVVQAGSFIDGGPPEYYDAEQGLNIAGPENDGK